MKIPTELASVAPALSVMRITETGIMSQSSDRVIVAVRFCVSHVEVTPFALNTIQFTVYYVQLMIPVGSGFHTYCQHVLSAAIQRARTYDNTK